MSFDAIHVVLLILLIASAVAAVVFMLKKTALAAQLDYLRDENLRLAGQSADLAAMREKHVALESGAAAREAAAAEQLQQLVSAESRLKENFENLANRIFDEKSTAFKSQSKEHLEAMLNPLKTQIGEFRTTVQQTNQGIHTLKELNLRMAEEATNLTRALKGDNKTQGGWGEQVLGRILDASGLTEGRDYHAQFSYVDEHNSRKQPDCIIFLPENKAIIVDSKVSLTAYDRYINAESALERETALKEHVRSLKNHIDGLSAKSYEELPGKRNLDFVLIFIPVVIAYQIWTYNLFKTTVTEEDFTY